MQTKSEIQLLLESAGVRPNKRLGQHFLIDLNLISKLVETADIKREDVILEVGCGTGSMTELLAEKSQNVIAVEIDHVLYKIASQKLADKKTVTILNTDVLKNKHNLDDSVISTIESMRGKTAGRFLLVANLPYNAASGLMINLVTGESDFLTADAMYVTIQKEVADRMIAKEGGKDYGTLSIFLNATGNLEYLRTLKPSVFWPQPQVNSAMVSYVRDTEKVKKIENMQLFSQMVGLFMQHRRKMLKAIVKFASKELEIINWKEVFKNSGIDEQKRPENLTPNEYILLANLCGKDVK